MTPAPPDAPGDVRLVRLPDEGWLGGVCAGIGRRIDLDPLAVRLITVFLTIATGGLAAVVYLVAWVAMPTPAELGLDDPAHTDAPPGSRAGNASAPAGSWGWRRGESGAGGVTGRGRLPRSGSVRLGLGVTLITLGVLLACRELGLWLSDAVVWPLVLAAGGAALVLRQIQVSGERERTEERGETEERRGTAREKVPQAGAKLRARPQLRGGFGVALILGAATLLLFTTGIFSQIGDAVVAVLVIAAAAALAVTPFLLATARRAREERRQRIRSEERAEVAAHLHDSVLQTLAMIQRQAGDSPEVATLARRQERELREWLSGRTGGERATSLAAALEAVAAEVEGDHNVPVDAVTVGDRELDRHGEALVSAAREAISNATRFGATEGQPATVSLYAELSPERATVFIRDRGPGFDPGSVPADRRGVRESIIGRMERHGGTATIRSQPGSGEGTEVELSMEFT